MSRRATSSGFASMLTSSSSSAFVGWWLDGFTRTTTGGSGLDLRLHVSLPLPFQQYQICDWIWYSPNTFRAGRLRRFLRPIQNPRARGGNGGTLHLDQCGVFGDEPGDLFRRADPPPSDRQHRTPAVVESRS